MIVAAVFSINNNIIEKKKMIDYNNNRNIII